MSTFSPITKLISSMDALTLSEGHSFSPSPLSNSFAATTPTWSLELVSSLAALRLDDGSEKGLDTPLMVPSLPSLTEALSPAFTDSLPPIMFNLRPRFESDHPHVPLPLSWPFEKAPASLGHSAERTTRSRHHRRRTPYTRKTDTRNQHRPSRQATEDATALEKLNRALHHALFTSNLGELDFDCKPKRRHRGFQQCGLEANKTYLQGQQNVF